MTLFTVASLLVSPLRTRLPQLTAVGILTASIFTPLYRSHTLRLDSAIPASSWSVTQYKRDADTPITTSKGRLNPAAIRQISMGSILGVVCGLGLSTFSGSLALIAGLLLAAVQTAEYNGIHIVPYKRLQRYMTAIDLRSAVQDNVAFKLSFGATLALTGFASF